MPGTHWVQAENLNDLQDLLNLDAGPASAAPSSGLDAFGSSLFGDAFGAAPSASASPLAFPSATAFAKDGISVSFAFAKPPGQPNVTDITATYTNSDAAPVTGFSLQVRSDPRRFKPRGNCDGH
jgi:hypothetical protein